MGEVQDNNLLGIKLFGATIAVQERQSTNDDEPKEADQTVEKRPQKIIPCPRCKSMETKFCYFNNYNVNQPRHFCKGCQRYWTSGGALRNVPVGSGRRKISKSPCQDLTGLSDGCLLDASGVQQFEFDTVVKEWQVQKGIFRQRGGPGGKKFHCQQVTSLQLYPISTRKGRRG